MKTVVVILSLFRSFTLAAVVSPAGYTSIEGNASSSRPFDQNDVRVQQVYSAPDFDFVAPGWIRGMEFRVDGTTGHSFSSTLSNIQINFSTTSKQPDSLSPVFAENVGLNDTIVYSGALGLHGTFSPSPGGGSNPFDVEILFPTRFFYDPSQGNLLLDIRNSLIGNTSPFDAVSVSSDSVSSVYANGAFSPSGTTTTLGLTTRFIIDPVPEPSSVTVVLTGLFVAGVFYRRNRRIRS